MEQRTWQIQEATIRLRELIHAAVTRGPQTIAADDDTVVVLSLREYQQLHLLTDSLVDFFQNSPLNGVKLDLERNRDFGRDVEL